MNKKSLLDAVALILVTIVCLAATAATVAIWWRWNKWKSACAEMESLSESIAQSNKKTEQLRELWEKMQFGISSGKRCSPPIICSDHVQLEGQPYLVDGKPVPCPQCGAKAVAIYLSYRGISCSGEQRLDTLRAYCHQCQIGIDTPGLAKRVRAELAQKGLK